MYQTGALVLSSRLASRCMPAEDVIEVIMFDVEKVVKQ